MKAPEVMLRLVDVRKSYRAGPTTIAVLQGIGLEVDAGDVVSIVGASGSGKTTLMNIIGLLDRPTSGACFLNGRDVAGLSDDELSNLRNEHVGFVFQSFHLLPQLTAIENVCLPLVYRGAGREQARQRAYKTLCQVGMGDWAEHRQGQLSGGQKQRVAIARALVGEPALLLADEPTGALDTDTANDVVALLMQLNAQQGVTILVITHDPLLARRCPRQVRLRDGRVYEADVRAAAPPRPQTAPGDTREATGVSRP